MTRPEALAYPVLCCSRDGSVVAVESPAELRACNALAWFKHRYFDDLRVFDARATPYRVTSAELAHPLQAWQRLLARILNRRLVVLLELDCLGEPSLARTKQTVTEWLHRAPDFWEASRDLAEWERVVSEAGGMEGLCAAFR